MGTPKYERGRKREQHSKYRSKLVDKLPKRLGLDPEKSVSLDAGIWSINYKDQLLIRFEATGGRNVEILACKSGRALTWPSRMKMMRDPEGVIEMTLRRLTREEREG